MIVGVLALVALRWTSALSLPLVVAAIFLLLLSPVVEALQRRGVSGASAAALVVFMPSLLVVVGSVLAVPSFLAWATEIAAAVSRFAQLLDPLSRHADAAGASARWMSVGLRSIDSDIGAWAAAEALPFTLTAASIVMLTFFLLLAQRSLLAGVLRALPDRRSRIRLLGACKQARDGIVDYLLVMTVMNLLLAIATGLVLWAMGFSHAAVWSVVIASLLFIPYLGPMAIALLLVAGAPQLSGSAILMAAPSAAFLVLHAVEANVISPWAMGHRLRVGRPALLVAVIVGGWTWGAIGGVLAVPLLIAARAGLTRMRGHAIAKALIAGEDNDSPSLAASTANVIPRASPDDPAAGLYPTQNSGMRWRNSARGGHKMPR
jgi:predicted PurR-regulated permease PerM